MRRLACAAALTLGVGLVACGAGGARAGAAAPGPAGADDDATRRAAALVPVLDDAARALCLLQPSGRGPEPGDDDCDGLEAFERFAGAPAGARLVGRRIDPLAAELRAQAVAGILRELDAATAAPFADEAAGHAGLHADVDAARARAAAAGAPRPFAIGGASWIRAATDLVAADADEARALDAFRERLLAKIGNAFAAGEGDRAAAEATDDALDELERAALPRGKTLAAVARLRAALDHVDAPPRPASADVLGPALRAATGETRPLPDVAAELERVRAAVAPSLDAALEALPRPARAEALDRAAALALGHAPCRFADAPSRIRGLAVPDERRAPCALAPILAGRDDAARLPALVAAHDAVVLALRALAAARVPGAAHAPALALIGLSPGLRAERAVASEPATVLASGVGAARLLARGLDGARAEAEGWLRRGDALYPPPPPPP